jgi:hypothetical protein
MIGLQAPLIPTRSATSSPQPPPPPASSRPPNASDASLFATPVTFPSSSTSQHCRQPSTASSDDFGDFVASDPLGAASAAARDASDDVPTDDLLQFSPVRERFLDGAARRVEEKREHLLNPLEELDGVNRPGFVAQNTGGFGSEPRPVPGSTRRRLSSTSSGGVRCVPHWLLEWRLVHALTSTNLDRPIMSPPRRLSHIMASPDPAPRPPPSPASSSTVSHAAGVIPSLLKTKSKWTSLLSSPSASTTPHAPNANADLDFEQHVTHTTPFHSHLGSAGSYVPPSGAPGFRPDDAPREGSQWDDLDERGIELVGRRETTVGILSSGAAEMVRLCFATWTVAELAHQTDEVSSVSCDRIFPHGLGSRQHGRCCTHSTSTARLSRRSTARTSGGTPSTKAARPEASCSASKTRTAVFSAAGSTKVSLATLVCETANPTAKHRIRARSFQPSRSSKAAIMGPASGASP